MENFDMPTVQREMPFFSSIGKAQWVPEAIVAGWTSYREAVIWCWRNRARSCLREPDDQAMFARNAGVHAPHMCRYVNSRTKSPMDLKPDLIPSFEAYTGWRGVTQYLAKASQIHVMEQVISERRVA